MNDMTASKNGKKNCGNCAKKRALNAQNGNQFGKDWVAFGVVFGTCIGSVFYVNYQPQPVQQEEMQMQ